MMAKCQARTKRGKKCNANALRGENVCLFHGRKKGVKYDRENRKFAKKYGYNKPVGDQRMFR